MYMYIYIIGLIIIRYSHPARVCAGDYLALEGKVKTVTNKVGKS